MKENPFFFLFSSLPFLMYLYTYYQSDPIEEFENAGRDCIHSDKFYEQRIKDKT